MLTGHVNHNELEELASSLSDVTEETKILASTSQQFQRVIMSE